VEISRTNPLSFTQECGKIGVVDKVEEEPSMATVSITAELTVKDLIDVISQLTSDELSEFTLCFNELQLAQVTSVDQQAVQIADAYRLPAQDRLRVLELLTKNREEGLIDQEETELDTYMRSMERRLEQVTDELFALKQARS